MLENREICIIIFKQCGYLNIIKVVITIRMINNARIKRIINYMSKKTYEFSNKNQAKKLGLVSQVDCAC